MTDYTLAFLSTPVGHKCADPNISLTGLEIEQDIQGRDHDHERRAIFFPGKHPNVCKQSLVHLNGLTRYPEVKLLFQFTSCPNSSTGKGASICFFE